MSGIFGFFSNKEKSPEEKSPEDAPESPSKKKK